MSEKVSIKIISPNPLFEKWLQEWKAEAHSIGSNAEYSYTKALQSLRKYPLPLNSGKECAILKGFGSSMCKKLDSKLKEYKRIENRAGCSSSSKTPISLTSPVNVQTNSQTERSEVPSYASLSKKPKKTPEKTYKPRYRSGAYAILMALNDRTKALRHCGYSTKLEVIEHAENYCDVSFLQPDPGSRYTAWSSMKILLAKNLVTKRRENKENVFALTAAGLSLTEELIMNQSGDDASEPLENIASNPLDVIDLSGNDETFGIDVNIQNKSVDLGAACTINVDSDEEIDDFKNQKSCLKGDGDDRFGHFDGVDEFDDLPAFTIASKSTSTCGKSALERKFTSPTITIDDDVIDVPVPSHFSNIKAIDAIPTTSTEIHVIEHSRENPPQNNSSTQTLSNEMQSNSENVDSLYDVILTPGSFRVILLVDLAETTKNKKYVNVDATTAELNKLNVSFESRKLNVGDFLWICRDERGRELVLPYIIERKRMDDLGSSIKDGRFHEQKYRLAHCGIPHLIYLIEDYGNNQHVGLPINSLYQAAINTQIQDGFIVKFTSNHTNSMQYVAVLTKILTNIFSKKTLTACAKHALIDFELTDSVIPLMTFTEFNESSVKTKKNPSVKQMFIRHLLQMKGISIDKAIAITDLYPTPKLLRMAYERCVTRDEAEKMLGLIRVNERCLGYKLSKKIYLLFQGTY